MVNRSHSQQPAEEDKVAFSLCDPATGICEIPIHQKTMQTEKKIRVVYFTDPICSACWAMEPQLRKLLIEYGDHIRLEYHMGGLLPSWEVYNSGPISKPSDVAHHWDEMSARSEMPLDGDVWLTDPLPSSYPSCMAYKAAELQGQEKASHFLRRVREMVMVEKKNIARMEHLQQAAADSGIDTAKLLTDYEGLSPDLFRKDLELCKEYGVRGFPAVFFTDGPANQVLVYGFRPYENYEAAIRNLAPSIPKKPIPASEELFNLYPTLTTKEFAVIKDVSMSQAEQKLSELEAKGAVRKESVKNGVLWKKRVH
jgi:putative protein-disulfide isomerase